MTYCPFCNNDLLEDSRYCQYCGKELPESFHRQAQIDKEKREQEEIELALLMHSVCH
ncbi:MAG: zinc-ribbon domain-containing protein [Methanobrevibacter sp.]|uniref:zinc-ribbon domain-containing protein n=1 Tax=Methanobrevibacter sp. TaxID=66852 RepID=UPI0026E063CA|nr:zinc-ribbon domain-containing protein [Methanobrevibacter sp.]MDO5849260.1 zinc-ribbon domain-containing protein [Methanobrevibacter sp.]